MRSSRKGKYRFVNRSRAGNLASEILFYNFSCFVNNFVDEFIWFVI